MGMPAMAFSLVLPMRLLSATERSSGKITVCTRHWKDPASDNNRVPGGKGMEEERDGTKSRSMS